MPYYAIHIIAGSDEEPGVGTSGGGGGSSPPNSEKAHPEMMAPILKRMKRESPPKITKQVHITHSGVRETSVQDATKMICNAEGFTRAELIILLKMFERRLIQPDMLLGMDEDILPMYLRMKMDEFVESGST